MGIPIRVVSAEGQAQEQKPSIEESKFADTARLERIFQRELKTHAIQAEILENLNQRGIEFKERLTELRGNGKGVSSLDNVLNIFYETLEEVKSLYNKADQIQITYASSNESGKVIDIDQAVNTIK